MHIHQKEIKGRERFVTRGIGKWDKIANTKKKTKRFCIKIIFTIGTLLFFSSCYPPALCSFFALFFLNLLLFLLPVSLLVHYFIFSTAVSLCLYDRYGLKITLLLICRTYTSPTNQDGSRLQIITGQCTPTPS